MTITKNTTATKTCRTCTGSGKVGVYSRETQVDLVPYPVGLGVHYMPQTQYRDVLVDSATCKVCSGIGKI